MMVMMMTTTHEKFERVGSMDEFVEEVASIGVLHIPLKEAQAVQPALEAMV